MKCGEQDGYWADGVGTRGMGLGVGQVQAGGTGKVWARWGMEKGMPAIRWNVVSN